MGKDWDKLDTMPNWQNSTGFSSPGIGDRETPWPSFSATSKFGATNPTCEVCGGRLRGAKKCSCDQPHDHWKPIGKRRTMPEDTPPDVTGSGMTEHLHHMQIWHEGWLRECYRVLKPGGVIKAFGGTRTFHRLAAAMENVGFVLDPKYSLTAWVYASGFPKSLNVGKAIDSHMRHGKSDPRYISETEATRPVVGYVKRVVSNERLASNGETEKGVLANRERWLNHEFKDIPVTMGASSEAKKFEGYGTALKPAWEPFIVGRKPGL